MDFSPIPQPPAYPFLRNLPLIESTLPVRSFIVLAKTYGEIFSMRYPSGPPAIYLNSHALVSQVCDDSRFEKTGNRVLNQARDLVGDALLTAFGDEPRWGMAHRILMPAFGTSSIRNMFGDMKDICDQLLLKWDRAGPTHEIDLVEDLTRLSFDSIGLCTMSQRFNSFYSSSMPEFTKCVAEFTTETVQRAFRPSFMPSFLSYMKSKASQFLSLRDTKEDMLDERRALMFDGTMPDDVLTRLITKVDSKTGKPLPDDSIVKNLLTFLVAGHETTSSTLSFCLYFLLTNPETIVELQDELDRTLGNDGEVTLENLEKMEYLTAVLRETLRLAPVAFFRTVTPKEDTKRYLLKKGTTVVVNTPSMQRDPRVWGPDAEEFRPGRMLDGRFSALPKNAWQPFGYGVRACIGRPFAFQECLLFLAALFYHFDVSLVDSAYQLDVFQTITLNTRGMKIYTKRREGRSPIAHTESSEGTSKDSRRSSQSSIASSTISVPLYVLYGSNSGTCEFLAKRVVTDARSHGFSANISVLDSRVGQLPKDGPILTITSSYEGEPPDNAASFVSWLQNLPQSVDSSPLSGASYAVFGCGNREWARTYQRVPTLIDTLLHAHGANRLLERGEADASSLSMFESFEEFSKKMWNTFAKRYDVKTIDAATSPLSPSLPSIEFLPASAARVEILHPEAQIGRIVENKILTKAGAPTKRHIEISLPDGMEYRTGDYLSILPVNPPEVVDRALSRFGVSHDQEIIVDTSEMTMIPTGKPVMVRQILSDYLELGQSATKRDLEFLLAQAKTATSMDAIKSYMDDRTRRISVLDALSLHPDIQLPFASFLSMMPPMRSRQYSISSSPLLSAQRATLTISVHHTRNAHPLPHPVLGVASTYLASLPAGSLIPLCVRPSPLPFHLPADIRTPVMMFAAGSGIAPFRGFVEERAALKAEGTDVGPMVLFFGCRAPDVDNLYANAELKVWTDAGVVDVRRAYSRQPNASFGCTYVQERVWSDRELVSEFYKKDAKFFACGSRRIINGIEEVFKEILKVENPSMNDDELKDEFEHLRFERFAVDVFN
ncbi:fatty acid hydroxylase [Schizopora paradoxa]|uniref:Fatty acid hydroxylase n=1 Tax=Schizopora paradoxa TaxID=27342 RepID=A0A0H2REA2_9AGAM|nr:fatty acid hydroxylase [Schizopora paradoxa]